MNEKAILRAGLAASRAELLWQLLGIPAGTLSAEPVLETLTVTDLLGRIADGDSLVANRIENLLAGNAPSSAPSENLVDPVPIHAVGRPLPEALDALLQARSTFLSALARIADAEATGAVNGSIRALCEGRIGHDAGCAVMIAAWPLRTRTSRMRGPAAILIAAMRAARKELLTGVALVPPEERASSLMRANQTLLDILARLTDLEAVTLKTVLSRESSGSDSSSETGRKSTNPAIASVQPRLSWQSVWTTLHTTHQALLRALAALDERELNQDLTVGATRTTIYSVICDCMARDRDQAAAIRDFLHL
jgi:hypothetical protein